MTWECAFCGNENEDESEECERCGSSKEESELELTQEDEEDSGE